MTVMILAALLAVQVSSPEDANVIVQKTITRHFEDLKALKNLAYDKESYTLDLNKNRRKESNGRGFQITILKLLKPGRYQYADEGLVKFGDREVWLIHFKPAVGKQPVSDRTAAYGFIDGQKEDGLNEVINRLEGEIWIDPETYGIIRLKAWLPEGMSVKSLKIYSTDILYEQQLWNGSWLPQRLEVTVYYEARSLLKFFVGWGKIHDCTITTFSNYREPH